MLVLARQRFGVPLDSKNETMARALEPFDEPVLCRGINNQPFAEVSDGLVVRRVDLQGLLSDDLPELRPKMDDYSMTTRVSFRTLLVSDRVGKLRDDILIQRAAQSYIDCLRAATDSQKGQIAVAC